MIPYVFSFLILAALAAPASDNRYVDAFEIYSCDFGEDSDVNFDQ